MMCANKQLYIIYNRMMVFNSTVANLKSQDGISSKPTNINKTCIANSPETIKRGSRERPQ